MSTHHALHYHIVFSTKNHTGFLQREWRGRLHAFMGGLVRAEEGIPLSVGGIVDHVHLLVSLTPSHRLSDFVRDIKRQSSAWVHSEIREPFFAWQEGYGVFSVSPTHTRAVSKYIDGQEAHHKRVTFKEEYLDLLKKGGVEYDERYLW